MIKTFKLISSRKWRQLKSHVESVSPYHGFSPQAYNFEYCVLQYACHYRPPLDVIECLFRADPNAIYDRDSKGRYTLHIACEQGCCPTVIKYILEKCPQAAEKLDKEGRSPFFLACKSYLSKRKKKAKIALDYFLEVSEILCVAAPMSIIKEDRYGMSGLELLLEEEVDMYIIRFVQIISANIRQGINIEVKTLINRLNKIEIEWKSKAAKKFESTMSQIMAI